MRETGRRGLENTCKKWAREHDWFVRKFRSPGHNADPDDVFIKDGAVLFVEFKARGKEPTELQDVVIKQMLAVGADVAWVDNVEDFKAVLDAREPHCAGCGSLIDPTTCGCGDSIDHSSWAGHSPVPLGCNCNRC